MSRATRPPHRRSRLVLVAALATGTALCAGAVVASPSLRTAVTGAETGPGTAEDVEGGPSGLDTQVNLVVRNDTGENLTLTSATSGGKDNHWQTRPGDIAAGATGSASNYALGDAEIDLTYQGQSSGAVFTLRAVTNHVDANDAGGASSDPSYQVVGAHGGGESPTDTITIQPGAAFGYTGGPQTYTVPPGISVLQVTATGGGTSGPGTVTVGNPGAVVVGDVQVSPGDVLLVGVAGAGGTGTSGTIAGGWGLSYGDSSYRGGNNTPSDDHAQNFGLAGGGATVLVNQTTGKVVVVAGGGGGDAHVDASCDAAGQGGVGGASGWSGGNGLPWPGGGGQAGANSGTQGQDVAATDKCAPGAGGGGLQGGLAGADGKGAGGGAGSSGAPGLTNATVRPGANPSGGDNPGSLVIAPPLS